MATFLAKYAQYDLGEWLRKLPECQPLWTDPRNRMLQAAVECLSPELGLPGGFRLSCLTQLALTSGRTSQGVSQLSYP